MKDLLKGVKDVSPFIVGVSPFGIIYGVAASQSKLSFLQSLTMSQIIFAGASQIALLELLKNNSSFLVIIATVFMINLRMSMYSASLAPFYRDNSTLKKALVAYFLVDQSYAVSILKFCNDDKINRFQYFIGAGIAMWSTWQISTLAGILIGTTIPQSFSLEFAIPLTFMALMVSFTKEKRFMITAITSSILMIILKKIPFNIGFFIAVFGGVLAGRAYERWRSR